MQKRASGSLLLIEIGADIEVPTLRYFSEGYMKYKTCKLIRIHPRDSDVGFMKKESCDGAQENKNFIPIEGNSE